MSRRNHHAYHDFSDYAQVPDAHLPEEIMISKRLESMNLNYDGHTQQPPQQQLNPTINQQTLIDQIPRASSPQLVSLNGKFKSSIPSIPEERAWGEEATIETNNTVFTTFKDVVPPAADCLYDIVDRGISGPNFFRSSMYNFPYSEALRNETSLPSALLIRPMADGSVPVSDFRGLDPPRCARCRAYMNPSMLFVDNGNKFICNLCNFANHTPPEYYQPTDPSNRRIDWTERSELAFGTYDLLVDGKYGENTEPISHVFICECTSHAQKAAIPAFVASVKAAIEYIPSDSLIAIAIFDHQFRVLSCYNDFVNIMTFMPTQACFPPNCFTMDRNVINKILDSLYDCCRDSSGYSSFGTFLEPMLSSLPNGGRASVFISSLPLVEPFKLKQRDPLFEGLGENKRAPSAASFKTEQKAFEHLYPILRESSVGIDVFVVNPPAAIDLPTIAPIAENSGGRLFYYPRFSFERDSRRVINDMLSCVTPMLTSARQATLAVRCSTGLQLKSQDKLLKLPHFLDSHLEQVVYIKHDANLDTKMDVHFQAALLYTDQFGERKLRIFNLMAGVTDRPKPVIKFVDLEVITKCIVDESIRQMSKTELNLIREAIREKIISIFTAARQFAGQGMPYSTMLMPTSYRELIMRGLSLTKSIAIGSHPFSLDSRVCNAFDLISADPNELTLMLYPRIYDLVSNDILPARYTSLLNSSGACLIFDGKTMYLWLIQEVQPSVLLDLLGCSTHEEVSPYIDELPVLGTELNISARELMAELPQRVHKSWIPLQIVRQQIDGAQYMVRKLMVEDPTDDGPAYRDFAVRVHERARDFKK